MANNGERFYKKGHKYNKKLIPNAKALRRNLTDEERHLWYNFLREYPVKYRRQAVINRYIADFYSPEAKLIIELDGSQHFEEAGMKNDQIRTEFLEQYGLTVVRIPNSFVKKRFNDICEYIDYLTQKAIETQKKPSTKD